MANVPPPGAAVMVGAPPQVLVTLGTAAITRVPEGTPAGSVSVNVRPERTGESAGFVIVNVSVEVWPTPIVESENALLIDGSGCTVRPLDVTAFVIRAVAVMLALVLLYGPPATFEMTSTLTWQEATALFIAAPVTVTAEPPAVAATNAGLATNAPPAGQLLC